MRRVVIESEHGQAMRWFDADKADEVTLPDGRVLAVTGRGVVTVRDAAGSVSAVEVDRDVAARLLTDAGMPLSALTMPSVKPRRDSPGRPAEGVKVDVRIPAEDLAVVEAVAAERGVPRAQVIRDTVAEFVSAHESGHATTAMVAYYDRAHASVRRNAGHRLASWLDVPGDAE